jgi:hypothetical protein
MILFRLGTEKRVEPGYENKHILRVPGPTAYNIPSKVKNYIYIKIN